MYGGGTTAPPASAGGRDRYQVVRVHVDLARGWGGLCPGSVDRATEVVPRRAQGGTAAKLACTDRPSLAATRQLRHA